MLVIDKSFPVVAVMLFCVHTRVAEVTQTQSGKKFGLVRKFQALTMSVTYAILLRYKDLSQFTHFLEDFGQKKCFFLVKNSVSWARSALLHSVYCILY